jgi:hypothetical protein
MKRIRRVIERGIESATMVATFISYSFFFIQNYNVKEVYILEA